MTDGELSAYMGTDAAKWAAAFCKIARDHGHDLDEGWVLGWFAIAIESARAQYYYARDHSRGPGAWCVAGPNGFEIPIPDKNRAYIIGKLLSGDLAAAKRLLDDLI